MNFGPEILFFFFIRRARFWSGDQKSSRRSDVATVRLHFSFKMADEKIRFFLLIILVPFYCVQCEGPEPSVTQPQCSQTKLLDLMEIFVTTRVSEVMRKFICQSS